MSQISHEISCHFPETRLNNPIQIDRKIGFVKSSSFRLSSFSTQFPISTEFIRWYFSQMKIPRRHVDDVNFFIVNRNSEKILFFHFPQSEWKKSEQTSTRTRAISSFRNWELLIIIKRNRLRRWWWEKYSGSFRRGKGRMWICLSTEQSRVK